MRNTILSRILLFVGSICFTLSLHAAQQNANALVSGILSYTSWDMPLEHLNFCIIDGSAQLITPNIFTPPSPLIRPNSIKTIPLESDELVKNPLALYQHACHVAYFVNTVDKVQQQLIHTNPSRILTISENNPECAIGSSFCLYKNKNQYGFKVNLSSLKRSNIRVNSKVLMLATPEGHP